jgi:predicted ArsR family transcriptional regulator
MKMTLNVMYPLNGTAYKVTLLQSNILDYLNDIGAASRRQLVEVLETPRTTVYDNLEGLEEKGLVERFKVHNGQQGRPMTYWRLEENE